MIVTDESEHIELFTKAIGDALAEAGLMVTTFVYGKLSGVVVTVGVDEFNIDILDDAACVYPANVSRYAPKKGREFVVALSNPKAFDLIKDHVLNYRHLSWFASSR